MPSSGAQPTRTRAAQPTREHRIEYMSLDAVSGFPGNPKAHNLPALRDSLQRFGYTSPIMIDEGTGRIVSGHGRIELLRQLQTAGKPCPEGVQRDAAGHWLVPVIRGVRFKSADDAKAFLIADNQLTMMDGWDDTALLDMLRSMSDLSGTGISDAFRQQLSDEQVLATTILGGGDTAYDSAFQPTVSELEDPIKCPTCGRSWSVKAQAAREATRAARKAAEPGETAPTGGA